MKRPKKPFCRRRRLIRDKKTYQTIELNTFIMLVVLAVVLQLFSLKIDPSVFLMSDYRFWTSTEFLKPDANNGAKVTQLEAPSDISGHWEGTITRDEGGGKRTVFKMELDLTQNGKDVTGTSYVHAEGEKRIYSANMSLVGRVNKNYLKYEEQKILNYDPIPDAEWCVKKCELRYSFPKGTTPTLEGVWEGKAGSTGSCIPGRIFLQKKPGRV